MSDLIGEWDGWQYFTGGTAISPEGTYYFEGSPVWSPDATSNPSSMISGAMGGLGELFGYALKTGVDTWSKSTLMQQNQEGQRYIEGQRLLAQQAQTGGIPPLFLLIGAGALFFALIK